MSDITLTTSDILSLPRDQLVTVQAGLLQDLIGAYQSLKDEVEGLRVTIAQQDEKTAALTSRVSSLESQEEQDITRIYCDIAQDRQRIAKLERPPEPQPTQKDRAEVLRALLVANNGKMLAKDARKKDAPFQEQVFGAVGGMRLCGSQTVPCRQEKGHFNIKVLISSAELGTIFCPFNLGLLEPQKLA